MPRKQVPIRTISCISIKPDGSEVVYLSDMTDAQREYIGAKLAEKLLNSQYAGKAEFTADLPPVESVFPGIGT